MRSSPSTWSAAPMATIATVDIAAQPSTSTVEAPVSASCGLLPLVTDSGFRLEGNMLVLLVVGVVRSFSAAEDDVRDGGGDKQNQDRADDHHEWECHRGFPFGHQAGEVFPACGAHVL